MSDFGPFPYISIFPLYNGRFAKTSLTTPLPTTFIPQTMVFLTPRGTLQITNLVGTMAPTLDFHGNKGAHLGHSDMRPYSQLWAQIIRNRIFHVIGLTQPLDFYQKSIKYLMEYFLFKLLAKKSQKYFVGHVTSESAVVPLVLSMSILKTILPLNQLFFKITTLTVTPIKNCQKK